MDGMVLFNVKSPTMSKRSYFLLFTFLTFGSIILKGYFSSYSKVIYFEKMRRRKQKQKQAQKSEISMKIQNSNITLRSKLDEICNMKIDELLKYIKKEKYNYKFVFDCYQKKALHVDQRLNCIVEFVKLDESDIDLNGPLAGLPFSIKDNITIKGYENYIGCSYFLNRAKPIENTLLLQVLQGLGAIPFVKTTVPQTMMTIGSSNPIDGSTRNPQNYNFQAGGSSCGEAGLVGAGGSILGFGSDIGGSVRIPAAFCGIVGFKPGVERLTSQGTFSNGVKALIKSTLGPITRDVDSCIFIMRHLVNSELMHKLDPNIPYVSFNEEIYQKKKLRIGYFHYDKTNPIMPAMQRAVEITVEKLKAQGHELIPWTPPRCGKYWLEMYTKGISIDGGARLRHILQYDKVDPAITHGVLHYDANWNDRLVNYIKYRVLPSWFVDPERRNFYRNSTDVMSGHESISLMTEVQKFRTQLIDDWKQNELDVVLCPAGGFTAFPSDKYCFYMPLLTSIILWNLVNLPAGTVPVTKVTKEDIDTMTNDPQFSSTETLRNIVKLQKDTINLSVSVQCVSLPWQEEMALNLMKQIESSFKH